MSEENKSQAVETMSHRQLRSEIKRVANRQYTGKGFVMNGVDFADRKIKNRAGLDNAWAAVLGVVLDNTKTAEVFEHGRRARKDQVGPGKMNHFLV